MAGLQQDGHAAGCCILAVGARATETDTLGLAPLDFCMEVAAMRSAQCLLRLEFSDFQVGTSDGLQR